MNQPPVVMAKGPEVLPCPGTRLALGHCKSKQEKAEPGTVVGLLG